MSDDKNDRYFLTMGGPCTFVKFTSVGLSTS